MTATATLDIKQKTPAEIVNEYVLADVRAKAAATARDGLKEAALQALADLGGSTELTGFKVTRSDPTKTTVDIDVLKANVSRGVFTRLTKRVVVLDIVRAYLTADRLSPAARKAITVEPDTSKIIITARA